MARITQPAQPVTTGQGTGAPRSTQVASAIPQPGQSQSIIDNAKATAAKNSDLADKTQYPDQVLAAIAARPETGPELASAVRQEQTRRQDAVDKADAAFTAARSGDSAEIGTSRPGARPLSVERGLEIAKASRDRALIPQEQAYLDALKTELGDSAFSLVQREGARPYAVRADERKFELPRIIADNKAAMANWDSNGTNTGTASAGVAGQTRTAAKPSLSIGPVNVQQTRGSSSQPAAGTPARSNSRDPGKARVDSLPLADTSPDDVFEANQKAVYRQKGVIVKRSRRPLTYQQQIVSKVAQMSGKTVTWIERASGAEKNMPNGFVNSFAGDHYFLDVDSTHPPLEILMHEWVHALPDHIRAKLKAVVLKNLSAEGKEAFLKEYGYSNKSDTIKDEEATAYVVQRITANPEFFQDLRKALGNKDFAELARIIIGKMRNWFQNNEQFDAEFLDKYLSNYKDVYAAAIEAYTQAMQEQGLTPDVPLADCQGAYPVGQRFDVV